MPRDACQFVTIFRQICFVETQVICSYSSASTPSSPATASACGSSVLCNRRRSSAGWALFGQSSAAEPAVVKCLVALGRTLLRRSARVTKEEGKWGFRRSARRVRRRRGWGLRAVGAVKKEEGGVGAGAIGAHVEVGADDEGGGAGG
ncbi:hypothetical protein GGG16DRAFT_129893 [Schizophyllum commune]